MWGLVGVLCNWRRFLNQLSCTFVLSKLFTDIPGKFRWKHDYTLKWGPLIWCYDDGVHYWAIRKAREIRFLILYSSTSSTLIPSSITQNTINQPSIYTTADGSDHNHERPSIPATPEHPSITPFQILNINNFLNSLKILIINIIFILYTL